MEAFIEWLKTNPDVFGFGVATLIFLFTLLLLARRAIGFFVTLLLLIFALVAGLAIVHQDLVSDYLKTTFKGQIQGP